MGDARTDMDRMPAPQPAPVPRYGDGSGDLVCSRCGLDWPDDAETLEPHECPSGFSGDSRAETPMRMPPKYDVNDRRFCSSCWAHPVLGRACTCSAEARQSKRRQEVIEFNLGR
jgi:hypothetical protein